MWSFVRCSRRILLGLLLVAGASPLSAQAPRPSRSDSADAHKNATRMQTWFERIRKANLPVKFSGSPSTCDARIGRFCQWNDREDKVPKEPKPIREARDMLLRALDSAAQ